MASPRTTEIILDGETYRIPTLTNDQLERIMDVLTDDTMATHKRAFRILPIMVEDAVPEIDPAKVRCTADEMSAAIAAVMTAAGVKTEAVNPPALMAVPRTDAA